MRRFGLLILACACAGFLAGPANAVRPPSGALTIFPDTLTTEHFQIHYTGELADPANPDRILHQEAGDLAHYAETAYATLTGWGYPAPPNDGDGRIDVWVYDLSATDALGLAFDDAAGDWIVVDPTVVGSKHVIAHEVLHLVQYGLWRPADSWLLEGSADWVGYTLSGFAPIISPGAISASFAAPDMSLDCTSDACGNDLYEIGGYSRWPFFQYLSERFGNAFVRDVLATGATLANPALTGAQILASTLVANGTTLSDVFNDYSAVLAAGKFAPDALKALPPTTHSSRATGLATGPLAVQQVAVNHLASRYVKFVRGGTPGAQCHAATLTITVALPAGIGSRPSFYSSSFGAAALPLAVNGNTASLSVPWDTCVGSPAGYLALPNPSLTADSRVFTVSGSLSVDTSTITTPSAPPLPIYVGATVAAPSTEAAPSILVYGAELVRVPAATRVVRLIVFSSGAGLLRASAGSAVIGTARLRAGNNDIRFRLPAALVKSLRRPAAVTRLTLTSLSTTGASGNSVVRKLAVAASKKGARR